MPTKDKIFSLATDLKMCSSKKNLQARRMQGDISCARCGADEESINHVFF